LVPLSKQAVALLRAAEPRPRRAYVFGEGAGPFSGWSRCKGRLERRVGLPPWTLHDIRRSWATHVNELTGAPQVVEAALNHLSGVKAGVAGTYNKASYLPERIRAMQQWADWLESAPTTSPGIERVLQR
jgi:integrase